MEIALIRPTVEPRFDAPAERNYVEPWVEPNLLPALRRLNEVRIGQEGERRRREDRASVGAEIEGSWRDGETVRIRPSAQHGCQGGARRLVPRLNDTAI